jgi:uncharacterized membrane protein
LERLWPLLFSHYCLFFAFAVHSGLLNPHLLSEKEVILRAHHNAFLGFGNVLVLFSAAIPVVIALRFISVAWADFIGQHWLF